MKQNIMLLRRDILQKLLGKNKRNKTRLRRTREIAIIIPPSIAETRTPRAKSNTWNNNDIETMRCNTRGRGDRLHNPMRPELQLLAHILNVIKLHRSRLRLAAGKRINMLRVLLEQRQQIHLMRQRGVDGDAQRETALQQSLKLRAQVTRAMLTQLSRRQSGAQLP